MKRRLIAALLIIALAASLLSLAGCGKKQTEEVAEENPEYGYKAEYKNIISESRDSYYNCVFTDDGFYTTVNIVVGEKEHEDPPEWEGQYDIYENRIRFITFDGKSSDTEYRPILPDVEEGHEINSWINSITLADTTYGKDCLVVIEDVNEVWSDSDAEMYSDEWYNDWHSNEQYYVRILDKNGNELYRVSFNTDGLDYFYPYDIEISEDSVLCCCDQNVLVASLKDGSTGVVELSTWCDNLLKLPDGRVGVNMWDNDRYIVQIIDTAKLALGEKIELPDNCYSPITSGVGYDFYFNNGTGFYGFNLGEKEEKLFSWLDIDVLSDDISGLTITDDGSIVGITNTWNNDYTNCSIDMLTITKVPFSELPVKQTVTMACQYLNWDVRSMIVRFNREHDNVRIAVKDYSEYNTEDDYTAGLTKLTTELISGKTPDILCLDGINGQQFAAKGLFEDLYTYIDSDSELSRDDLFPNVLAIMENKGQLYSTVSGFTVMSLCGASSVVGDKAGWTYDEFNAALAQMRSFNPDCTALDSTTDRYEILRNCLCLDMDDFIDWNTGKCSFDSQEFVDLLKFTATFPDSFDWSTYDYTDYEEPSERISRGEQMLLSAYMHGFDSIFEYDHVFGGNCSFIGFPSNNGSGNMLSSDSGYAMCTSCCNKEAAWEFLRTFFTEEYQSGKVYNFPSNVAAYKQMRDKATTPEYEKDGDGNYLLDENGERIQVSRGGMAYENGEVVEFYAISEDQAKKIDDLVMNTRAIYRYDDVVYNNIIEQIDAFYSGQKSAEEVAKLIQSKMTLYVNEQR